jgi:hypothetical protein
MSDAGDQPALAADGERNYASLLRLVEFFDGFAKGVLAKGPFSFAASTTDCLFGCGWWDRRRASAVIYCLGGYFAFCALEKRGAG